MYLSCILHRGKRTLSPLCEGSILSVRHGLTVDQLAGDKTYKGIMHVGASQEVKHLLDYDQ
jgi:hypothetical protein